MSDIQHSKKSSGFQFKQFFVDHSQCAMKVGTDSIMLGSWIELGKAQHILDIGCGSGILSLMVAQHSLPSSDILGIDIDNKAVQQATENANNSPWAKQLSFVQLAIQALKTYPQLRQTFDLIISNPPYFAVNTHSNQQNKVTETEQRVVARQTSNLAHNDLLESVCAHLHDEGCFYCVLPADVGLRFIEQAELFGLYNVEQLAVRASPEAKITRLLLKFSRKPKQTIIKHLTIYTKHTHYSDDYIKLCKAFYLRF